MANTLTKPILLDETGVAIKTALNNINDTESQDWLLTYEDVHSEMDDTLQDMAGSLKAIKNILDHGTDYTIPSWSEGTDEEIVRALADHYEGKFDLTKYWAVGDERTVHLSAITDKVYSSDETIMEQDITLVILDIGGKELTTPINNHNECAFVVGVKQYLLNSINTTTDKVNGADLYLVNRDTYTENGTAGWEDLDRRTWMNTFLKNAISPTVSPIFKQFKVIATKAYQDTDPEHTTPASKVRAEKTITDDYFTIPSMTELYGFDYLNYIKEDTTWNSIYTIESELKQFDYYNSAVNRTNSFYSNEIISNLNFMPSRTIYRDIFNESSMFLYTKNDTYGSETNLIGSHPLVFYGVI